MGAKGLRYPERRTHPTARFGWVILSLLQVLRAVVVDASPAFGASGLWLVQPGPPWAQGSPLRARWVRCLLASWMLPGREAQRGDCAVSADSKFQPGCPF